MQRSSSMKKLIIAVCVYTLCTFSIAAQPEDTTELDPHLSLFEHFLGTWEATFEMVDENPTVVDVTTWERALNGKAIRTLHSINDGMYGGESLIFWDKEQQKLVFYYFTTANFFTRGHIEVVNEKSFIAYEDVSGSDDGIAAVKSTSTLTDEGIIVATSYLKGGEWTNTESRTYKPSTKSVIFR